ncbi:wash complex subunit [Anaeramoeba flamelloides]|uniref:Wash complex subunit n=1 Tax=Anaeramoeba flamelloides TaxID=1746091 RepID=A0AAV7YDT4_9EUKA|nr:wash complex subunit [Anaeramoeba flamelloides]
MEEDVNYEELPGLSYNKTITYINDFVIKSVHFLNKFSTNCERKLSEIDSSIKRLDTIMNIFEDKLSSIEGLDDIDVPRETTSTTTTTTTTTEENKEEENQEEEEKEKEETQETSNVVKLKDDLRYRKWCQLVMRGVPKVAIRMKMEAEGLDPDLLDDPEQPAPPMTDEELKKIELMKQQEEQEVDESEESEEISDGEFSD